MRQLYNQVPQMAWVSSSWSWSQLETRCQHESQRQTEGFGPSVTHGWATKPRWERSTAMVRRNLGQYVAVCPRLQLTSHTPQTNINPFKNEVWEIYFYKEVCSFVHWSSSLLLTMFPRIFVYVCGYTTLLVFSASKNIYMFNI